MAQSSSYHNVSQPSVEKPPSAMIFNLTLPASAQVGFENRFDQNSASDPDDHHQSFYSRVGSRGSKALGSKEASQGDGRMASTRGSGDGSNVVLATRYSRMPHLPPQSNRGQWSGKAIRSDDVQRQPRRKSNSAFSQSSQYHRFSTFTASASVPTFSSWHPPADDIKPRISSALVLKPQNPSVIEGKSKGALERKRSHERERERQEMEAGLETYNLFRPAGAIESMRKSHRQLAYEAKFQLNTSRLNQQTEIVIRTHRRPFICITSNRGQMDENLKAIKSGDIVSYSAMWPSRFQPDGQCNDKRIVIASCDSVHVMLVARLHFLPRQLRRILNDPTIIKCGVSVGVSARKVRQDFRLHETTHGLVELNKVEREVSGRRPEDWTQIVPLREMCRIYLNHRLDEPNVLHPQTEVDERTIDRSPIYAALEILYKLAALVEGENCRDLFTRPKVMDLMEKVKQRSDENVVKDVKNMVVDAEGRAKRPGGESKQRPEEAPDQVKRTVRPMNRWVWLKEVLRFRP